MPYISAQAKEELHTHRGAKHPGELNYCLSAIIAAYIEDNGLSYQVLNDVSGAMTEALAEFRRRIVIPYEGVKQITGVDPYEEIRPGVHETDLEWSLRLRDGKDS